MSSFDLPAYGLDDFDFELPNELIAQYPPLERSASRLLDGSGSAPIDRVFRDFPSLLSPSDLLVFNNTEVIKARLYGQKTTGGRIEVLIERILPQTPHEVWAHIRASKAPQPGQRLILGQAPGFTVEVISRCGPDQTLFHLRFPQEALALLQQFGHIPLPPYITHRASAEDEQRYQTIFATRPGAVAAPTAALHFDDTILEHLRAIKIQMTHLTLHVGAGTFQPIRTPDVAKHKMHTEWFEIPASTVDAIEYTRQHGGRVIAIGTTTLRALESAALSGNLKPGAQETDIFIRPGFQFQVVDALLTNFHLPKSTLLLLVSAFRGLQPIRSFYQHAIQARYRFFSYGDAMWLTRPTNGSSCVA